MHKKNNDKISYYRLPGHAISGDQTASLIRELVLLQYYLWTQVERTEQLADAFSKQNASSKFTPTTGNGVMYSSQAAETRMGQEK